MNEQGKASRKLSHLTSSSSRPPRSMAHQSSLDAIPAPKSQESCNRPYGSYQPRKDSYKGSGDKFQNRQSYKQHYSGYSAKGKQQSKDQSQVRPVPEQFRRFSHQDKDRRTSQQSRNFQQVEEAGSVQTSMDRVISGQSRNHLENFRGNSDSLRRRLSYTSSSSIGAPQQ